MTAMLAALAPWAAAAMAVVVAWMTGRANRRAKEVEAQESPYQALAERVVKLEAKVERLERERQRAVGDYQSAQAWQQQKGSQQ